MLAISSKVKKILKFFCSLRFFIFIVTFVLNVTLLFAFRSSIENVVLKKINEQKLAEIETQCNILANQIILNQFSIYSSTDNLNVEIDQLANVLDGRVMVIDSSYKIIKDTYTIKQGKYIIDEDVFNVMSGDEEHIVSEYTGHRKFIEPIVNSNKDILGAIIITVSTSDEDGMHLHMRTQSNVLISLFLVIAFVVSFALSSVSVRGLKQLNKQLDNMSEGHLDEVIVTKGFSETNHIVDSLNTIVGKMQILEESRQEFVSNVSHELKTPITSMKVLADSLVAEDNVPNEMYREFMTDIAEEIDRENSIINDLLTLVKTDKKSADLNIQNVSINALLELLLKRLKPLAAKRNIEVVYESFRDVSADIDEIKLSLAISNLIENAIKYNVDNGWVKVSLNADHKFFYIKIVDSGVGIPEDCQEHVFERFYRVDKARTRQTGGTGLGLAITRNAVLLHKGAIKLFSKPNEGTTFTVRIPLKYIA